MVKRLIKRRHKVIMANSHMVNNLCRIKAVTNSKAVVIHTDRIIKVAMATTGFN